MITLEGISKHYNKRVAVNNISFHLKEGEILVLLGTSGSGKTTTLRMINRLVEPTSGEILIDGKSVFSIAPAVLRRTMGYVLQSYGLFPHYTVEENIAIVPKLLHWPKEKIKQRTIELLNKLQLPPEEFMQVYPDKLSGGQKQRVSLARAMAANPPILLMDEPFGALDPITRADIRKEFSSLDELKNKTVILVTHDVQEAFTLGDKIGLMDKGDVVQMGKPAELLFHPQNDFVKQFLDHQRLQLELNTISLKSIWDSLDNSNGMNEPMLNSHQNLWQAIEILTQQDGIATVFDEETNTLKTITFTNLHTALKIVKQK
jgi:osmoprotectant transport system ATP-binding protein